MNRKPLLAIIGRPNVGKSALFNRICKKRIAIVDEAEGVTRDRLYAEAEGFGYSFGIIDTGGIDPRSPDQFREEIRNQALAAVEEADTLVMVVDGRVGITQLDIELSKILLKTQKPLCLAINKIDDLEHQYLVHAFHPLGISKMIPVSASSGLHIAELIEAAWENVFKKEEVLEDEWEEEEFEEEDDLLEVDLIEDEGSEEPETLLPLSPIKIAIVGRPNTGKSTLINALLQEERCIVSPIAGTTRDSIDIPITVEGTDCILIDTAGIRRKQKELDVVEKFAALRTESSIERCDLCLLVIDAKEGITAQEKKIINSIEESGKGCIVLINKWDLIHGFRMEHCLKAIHEDSPFLAHCPTLFISAKENRNLDKIFPEVKRVFYSLNHRISTHQLNKFLERTMQLNHPPMIKGKRLRIYYMTQVETLPPRFVLFVNYPELMTKTYKKYIMNQFRQQFKCAGIPLLFHLKGKERKEFTPKDHD